MSGIINIFNGKLKSGDERDLYSKTPHPYSFEWQNTIKEARGGGIKVAAFGDTKDKLVLHPGHLGYPFDYSWGRGMWGGDCWDATREQISEANARIFDIAKKLSEHYSTYLVNVSGTGKGYLSTELFDATLADTTFEEFAEKKRIGSDLVIFVYKLTDEKMIEYISSLPIQ